MKLSLFVCSLLILFASCTKQSFLTAVPPAAVTYNILDSMKLMPEISTYDPVFYAGYHDKTYTVHSTKVIAGYRQDGSDLILWFRDTAQQHYESELSIIFKGRTVANLSGTYTAQDDVYYASLQQLSANSKVLDAKRITKGTIHVQYDAATKTIQGAVQGLQYAFGVYVPYYFPGNTVTHQASDGTFLHSGGSFRRHNIQFGLVPML